MEDISLLGANILIVDDKVENILLIEKTLNAGGYTNIVSTSDPREVKDIYVDNDIDIVLLDLYMPHLNGFTVIKQLHEVDAFGYVPILVITSDSDVDTKIKALKAGAKDFLNFPFSPTEVLCRVSNMLQVRLLYKERVQQADILEQQVAERTEELQTANADLEEVRLEVIRCLGRAGEYNDYETGMHVQRMSRSCKILALGAGLGEHFAELLLQASPLHDVGKIGIPDAVLLKPAKFEPEEWEVMKTHVQKGAEIIGENNSELMNMARAVILTHHEKWDGSGYPEGLSGEDIPIEGRIASICDVFDALTSPRPYKKSWPIDEAIRYLEDQSGIHFDPTLVEHFKRVLPDILVIREQFPDEHCE